jgi:UDP-glucose:(heptosyl)LPS alpha-1,3-glucosyltransferase
MYYGLIMALERYLYAKPRAQLILIARKTAEDLNRFYGPHDELPVVYMGIDHTTFNPSLRKANREGVRRQLGIHNQQFVLLLVGNDWRKKGLHTLLGALPLIADCSVLLLVVGDDEKLPYQEQIQRSGLSDHVRFLPSRRDIAFYYAAADAYVGPSLEDTFAQPPAEAMACGLSVITSITNGTAEIITAGFDGLIVQDPSNAEELAAQIRRLCRDPNFLHRLGENAANTALRYTWDQNGEQMKDIFMSILRRKKARLGTDPAS